MAILASLVFNIRSSFLSFTSTTIKCRTSCKFGKIPLLNLKLAAHDCQKKAQFVLKLSVLYFDFFFLG